MGRRSGLRRALNGADGGGDFPWLEWRDGRPRRLKRGKHYTGDSKLVERRARIAAEDLGKIAVTSKDGSGGYEYLWIQFVDAEVEVGRPCPVCGSIDLVKAQKYFLRCSICGSTLKSADGEVLPGAYALPVPEPTDGEDGRSASERLAALPSGDYGEIVRTRVLSASGREAFELSAAEEITVETTIRFAGPVVRATLKLWIAVEEAGAVLRLRCPEKLQAEGPETIEVAVRIPPALLASREYGVSVGVHYMVDMLQSGTERMVDSSARFRVRDARLPGLESGDEDDEAVPAFSWTISSRADRADDRVALSAASAASVGPIAAGGGEDLLASDEDDEEEDDDRG